MNFIVFLRLNRLATDGERRSFFFIAAAGFAEHWPGQEQHRSEGDQRDGPKLPVSNRQRRESEKTLHVDGQDEHS